MSLLVSVMLGLATGPCPVVDNDALQRELLRLHHELKVTRALLRDREDRLVQLAGERRPPPEGIEGKVVDVLDDNLLLVALGRTDGAKKGIRVEIYRLQPKSLYLGCGEVVAAGKRFSTVRILGKPGKSPQTGDLIAGTVADETRGVPHKLPGGAIEKRD